MSLVNELNIRPEIAYFGSVQDRDGVKNFGILADDRRRHMYCLGKTGMGKSTLLTNLILQDIHNGHGCCFLDPHGETVEYVLERIPEHRKKDVVYFNPADTEFPVGFNIFESVNDEQMFLLAAGMMSVFQRIWEGAWSARMEYILNNTLLALLETPGNTLLDVVRMLTDDVFRKRVIDGIIDPVVKNFWIKEFASFNDKYRTEAIAPILNKVGQFFSTSLIRNILGQQKSTINIRQIMDEGKILLINLSKGRLGEDNSNLLGSMMITRIQLAAMSRVDIPENERRDFYMYVDEFQNFITDTFAVILSEARKYRLSLILAHQYIAQLTESDNQKVKNAIFGNVGTMLTFRVGAEDGEALEKEFAPIFTYRDLTKLNKAQIALKMTIGGRSTTAFLASTIAPLYPEETGLKDEIINLSREQFTTPQAEVSAAIRKRLEPEIEPGDTEKDIKKKKKASIAYVKTREDVIKERKDAEKNSNENSVFKSGDLKGGNGKSNQSHRYNKDGKVVEKIKQVEKFLNPENLTGTYFESSKRDVYSLQNPGRDNQNNHSRQGGGSGDNFKNRQSIDRKVVPNVGMASVGGNKQGDDLAAKAKKVNVGNGEYNLQVQEGVPNQNVQDQSLQAHVNSTVSQNGQSNQRNIISRNPGDTNLKKQNIGFEVQNDTTSSLNTQSDNEAKILLLTQDQSGKQANIQGYQNMKKNLAQLPSEESKSQAFSVDPCKKENYSDNNAGLYQQSVMEVRKETQSLLDKLESLRRK